LCKHEKQRAFCVQCGGSQVCKHLKCKHDCRLCNPKHPFFGIDPGHGRGSDFEHKVIESVLAIIPAGCTVTEQANIANSDPTVRHAFRMDLLVDLPDGKGSFVVEADGDAHYVCDETKALKPIPKQLARDRYVEDWCLERGMSIFRIPYTFVREPERAAVFILQRALADIEAGVSRVYYLDYMKTYYKINEYAVAGRREDVQLIQAERVAGGERAGVFVGRTCV
jgi:hypothetical protein